MSESSAQFGGGAGETVVNGVHERSSAGASGRHTTSVDVAARGSSIVGASPGTQRKFIQHMRAMHLSLSNRIKKAFEGANPLLLGGVVALISSRTIDQVLYYRLNYSYSYFIFWLSTIYLPVAFLCVFGPVVAYKLMFTNDITPEQKAFPKYKFAVMGIFDALFNLFSTFPVQHLGGDLSNVLSQAVLPINMLFAMIFLKTKFKKNHYLGAFLVLYGIAIKLSDSDDWSGTFGWVIVMILAQTPAAASNIYKQMGLQTENVDLDIWYANFWIGVFQLFLGLLTFWTMYIGAFMDPHPALKGSQSFGDYVVNANECFFGETVTISGLSKSDCEDSDTVDGTYHHGSGDCDVDCSSSDSMPPAALFLLFIVFNICYNQLTLLILKHGSSVLFVVASAVRLPLVDALNSWKWIAGPAQDDYSATADTFALIALVLAITIYYSEPEETDNDDGTEIDEEEKFRLTDTFVDPGPRNPSLAGERLPSDQANDLSKTLLDFDVSNENNLDSDTVA